MDKIWSLIEKNRFAFILPITAILLWLIASSCSPTTSSPLDPMQQVTAVELKGQYITWQSTQESTLQRFELAAQDINEQQAKFDQLQQTLITIASGNVADLPGLATLLIGGGGFGFFLDNLRKNGVIAGLKRNKIAK